MSCKVTFKWHVDSKIVLLHRSSCFFCMCQHNQGTQPPVKPQVSKVQQKLGDSSTHRILFRHWRLRNSTSVCCGLDSPVEHPTQLSGARTKHWLQDVESNLAKLWLPHFLPLSSNCTLIGTCNKGLPGDWFHQHCCSGVLHWAKTYFLQER